MGSFVRVEKLGCFIWTSSKKKEKKTFYQVHS